MIRMGVTNTALVILALAGPVRATASRSLEVLVSDADVQCNDYSAGALSHDGQHLLITQNCPTTEAGDWGDRGTLWRQFRSSNDPANRIWTPGYFSGLSGDGRTAVGEVLREIAPYGTRYDGVILRDSGETLGIGVIPGGHLWGRSFATAISADGSTVVGGGENASGDPVPARWTAATGLLEIPMGSIPPFCSEEECDSHQGYATGVSQDGAVIVGNLDGRAFRWDALQGMRPLLADGSDETFGLRVLSISGDASSVVGTGIFDSEWRPFIWSEATGLIDLHDPAYPLGQSLVPKSISRDGSVVVGGEQWGYPFSTFSHDDRAFIWTRENGFQDLRTALEDLGIETAPWASLLSAWAVSGDGSTIVGTGYRFDGDYEKTFHASLLPAPRLGVGLCDLSEPDCVGVEILARSGQTFRYGVELSTLSMGRIASVSHAILNTSGDVAFSARVVNLEDSQNGTTGAGWSVVFGPDGSGKSRICPINPYSVPILGISQEWFPDVDPRSIALLDDGDVYFGGPIDYENIDRVWRCNARSNEVDSLAIVGVQIPDEAGEHVHQILDKFQLDTLGRVSFRAMISTSGSPPWARSIVGTGPGGNLEVRIRSGELPPGVTDLTYGGSYFHAMGPSGKLAFVGTLGPFGQHSPDQQDALWGTSLDGALTLILRTGDPAPGFAGAKTFRSLHAFRDTPAVNSRGDVATTAVLEGEDPFEPSVWKWSPDGALTLIAREGELLPGLLPGRSVVDFDSPLINDRGDILLSTILDYGPSQHSHGYWLHTADGERIPLLQTGQAAPALPDGVVLGESTYVETPSSPDEVDLAYTALSESGLVLIEFDLAGVGVDETNDRALYLLDRTGAPTLVLRRGDAIPVAHEDVRTVDDFRVWYGYRAGSGRSPINDRGDVAAILDFTDGTQAVVKLTVPEPEPWMMLTVGSIALRVMMRKVRPGSAAWKSARH